MSANGTRLGVVVADLRVGGLQAMAVRLALALRGHGFDPRFYTFDGLGPLEASLAEAAVPARLLPRGEGLSPGYARTLARALVDDAVALVHCHNVTALFHGGRAAARARIPVLYTEHDREIPGPWKQRLLHRWLARRARAVVAVSERIARDLARWEGFPRERLSVVVNGIDDPRAEFDGPRAGARSALGWDERPVVLAVGSLTEVKNHAGLIAAFARLRRARPDARLAIAGVGPLRADLEARITAAGLGEHVTLLGERRDVPRLLAACEVFVLPSFSEGLSLSLVEAHAAGRPSVATDVGGNGEVIVDGRTGRLVPLGDEAALAEALARYLDEPALAAEHGEAARARYLERFTHERMVARYAELLHGVGGS